MPADMAPRLEVVGDRRRVHSGLLGENRELDEVPWSELLRGGFISELQWRSWLHLSPRIRGVVLCEVCHRDMFGRRQASTTIVEKSNKNLTIKHAREQAEVTMNAGELKDGDAEVVTLFQARAVFSDGSCDARTFAPESSPVFLLGGPDETASPTAEPTNATFVLEPRTMCFEFGVAKEPKANGATIEVRWTFNATQVEPTA